MKLTNYFSFAASLAMFAPAIVIADTWAASIVCLQPRLELTVGHRNKLGRQSIVLLTENTPFDAIQCSEDQVLCIKEVSAARTNCENISVDFKVQFGNAWSENIHANLSRLRTYHFGTVSDLYYFEPTFT
ncbi:hypothetical protein BD560DRAFT_429392 [Blakeslea trispora]|nr:hypothetical protein BD560DRAFT_429392 [Blakeslea trispora]